MKKILSTLLFITMMIILSAITSTAQNTFPSTGAAGIGTLTPNASSLLDVTSITKGVLIPRMTKTQRDAITSPATGLLIYQTNNTPGFYYYNGTAWNAVTTKKGWSLTGNTGTVAGTNFIGTTDAQPLMFKINNNQAGYIDYDAAKANTGFGYQTLFSNSSNAFGNTAIGYQALFANTTGNYNTANGYQALYANTTGHDNTANGSSALYNNTTGSNNTANGRYALYFNTTGYSCTANGYGALNTNSTGYSNTANGSFALAYNTTGTENTANGVSALYRNTTGFNNTANGVDALRNNTTGYYNSANGAGALYSNTTGFGNTANGSSALYSNTTGSVNTANGYQALLYNTTGYANTATGHNALVSNTTGNNNTAHGYQALSSNTTGYENTATGLSALAYNTTGAANTANGSQALLFNTTGNLNTANGQTALYANTTGSSNTANGMEALHSNTTGSNNTANGYEALYSNTTGYGNTANGNNALISTSTGYYNTANGRSALYYNTTGFSNAANGNEALYYNTTGFYNTANGDGALYFNTTGVSNTANGFNSLIFNTTGNYNSAYGRSAYFGSGTVDNTSCFGYTSGGAVSASNRVEIGNTSVSVIAGQVGFSTFSDERIKDNIKEDVPGLAFISKLRPVTYNLNIHKENAMIYKGTNKDEAVWDTKYDIEKIKMTGFLAQDVEKAAKETGYDFSGVQKPANPEELYSLRYSDFVMPLVKAVQELSNQDEGLKMEDGRQKSKADSLQFAVYSLQKENTEMKNQIAQLQSSIENIVTLSGVEGQKSSMTDGFAKLQIPNSPVPVFSGKPETILGQNIPNPFDYSTLIPFRIPKDCKDASIMITNTSTSEVISVIPISCNEDHVSIDAGILSSGTYSYTLYVDGRKIDTKTMELLR